jgi:hypothetical protein
VLVALSAHAARPRALVVTTNFETGGLATVGMAPPRRPRQLPTSIFSDAVVRVTGGYAIVLDRFLDDSVQVLSHRLRTRLRCSTGAGSNPHDIVVVAHDKAYVTRYGAPELWIVDPSVRRCGRFRRGAIDLSAFADADGLPEMDQIALVGTRLFVSVQRLDRTHGFAPSGHSQLVVIDTTTDTVVPGATVTLAGSNAFGDASGIVVEPGTGKLVVNVPGDIYQVGDGGLEWVDPGTDPPVSEGVRVGEMALGGNVTDFVLLSPTRGYAVVQARDLQNRLVAFDPTQPSSAKTIFTRNAFLPDLKLAPDGFLWLADQSRPAYGLRIFDPAHGDVEVTHAPIDVGLPPFSIGFLR